jgi:hypothetical protein
VCPLNVENEVYDCPRHCVGKVPTASRDGHFTWLTPVDSRVFMAEIFGGVGGSKRNSGCSAGPCNKS